MACCPQCGHTWNASKRKAAPEAAAPVDTSTMTKTELYAHYKATAPEGDVWFWLKHAKLSPALRLDFEALLVAKLPRVEHYRRLTALQDRWRREDHWRRVALPTARTERRRQRAATRAGRVAVPLQEAA